MFDEWQESNPTVYAILGDPNLKVTVESLILLKRFRLESSESKENFKRRNCPSQRPGCVLTDHPITDRSAVIFWKQHLEERESIPVIVVSDQDDISIEIAPFTKTSLVLCRKTVQRLELSAKIDDALALDLHRLLSRQKIDLFRARIGQLTKRQAAIMQLLLTGDPNKVIAANIGVSERTVEMERAEILRIFHVKNAVNLAVLIAESRMVIELDAGTSFSNPRNVEGNSILSPHLFGNAIAKLKKPTDTGSLG